jgi:hypothetical protein
MPDMKLCGPGFLPPACAACGGQYPDRKHVDFGAAWDGPVLNQAEVIAEGVTPMQIDDLKVCETCVREAAEVLALSGQAGPRMESLKRRLAAQEAINANQKAYIEQLERALQAKRRVKDPVPA